MQIYLYSAKTNVEILLLSDFFQKQNIGVAFRNWKEKYYNNNPIKLNESFRRSVFLLVFKIQ